MFTYQDFFTSTLDKKNKGENVFLFTSIFFVILPLIV